MLPTSNSNIVYENPYPNEFFNIIDMVAQKCFCPMRYFLDQALSCLIPTTRELKRPHTRLPYYFIVLPVCLVLTALFCPVTIFAFCIWYPIRKKRRPYRYSYVPFQHGDLHYKGHFAVLTTNLCLLPECLSRFNNLSHHRWRAKKQGQTIAASQINKNSKPSACSTDLDGPSTLSYRQCTKEIKNNNDQNSHQYINGEIIHQEKKLSPFDHSVLTDPPTVDFVFIQEAFDRDCAKDLGRELHGVYPYIVYDAGVDSWATNCYLSNSGVLLASRYPILETRFGLYQQGCFACRLASKGLLQVKVNLGKDSGGQKFVGYLGTTHLQAYQGDNPIHTSQLDDIDRWLDEFRRDTWKPDEIVAFDLVGGDFNVDNMSPVDRADWYRPLFQKFEDVCRVRPGLDQDWTIGTEMRHIPLDDRLIQTPAGLKQALEDPYLRQHYVLDADVINATLELDKIMPRRDKNGNPILSPVGGRRRIDYILYRKGDCVTVTACNPVTFLAGLTDHIPVCLSFATRST